MTDQFGRSIEYLRLSVTDSCNLRCLYCKPSGHAGASQLPPDIIKRLVKAFVRLGIVKVRITGGEPLLRSDIADVVRAVSCNRGIRDIAMTTNATRLSGLAAQLKNAGLRRLNISLDSLDPDKFRRLTGGGHLPDVLSGIYEAIDAGLQVKINTVLVKGVNDGEVDALIGLAKDLPLHVRFIELMPLGPMDMERRVSHQEIIDKRPWLIPVPGVKSARADVATLYTVEGYSGQIGFINPVSHKFCDSCNRVRITSDGKLKPCLGDNAETDLMPFVHDGKSLLAAIREALYHKPKGHCFDQCAYASVRSMDRIGG